MKFVVGDESRYDGEDIKLEKPDLSLGSRLNVLVIMYGEVYGNILCRIH